ncbi:MAG: tetratricopeptide repeat protein [Bacillus sp. (in: firmicutes)]
MSKDSKIRQSAKILSFHPTGEYYFNKGLKAYHQRDLYKAKKFLGRAQDLEPFEPMIACQLAIVCTDLGEYSHSNTILDTIINDLDPYMSECHYFLANNYAHLGMFQEAYRHASEYLKKEKYGEFVEDTEELMELITLESGETEEILREEDSLITEQDKARTYLEAGNFKKAAEVLAATIKEHPTFWYAYNNLALAQFYMGEHEKAFGTLELVLEKNPGNLHAMCNLLVFHYYGKNEGAVQQLSKALEKVRPILPDQQYKLGATFALVGHYKPAYEWLKQLQKRGFDGDDSFYYWLAACAHHLGYGESSRRAWQKVMELNPDKEGMEPWNEVGAGREGMEQQLSLILKKLDSEFIEERLFGMFLFKHCSRSERLSNKDTLINPAFTETEKQYMDFIINGAKTGHDVQFADQVAEQLYRRYSPISMSEAGLYVLWFAIFAAGQQNRQKFINPMAWAAAAEYVWHSLREEKVTQKELSEIYGVSPSTLRKYVNLVNELLN